MNFEIIKKLMNFTYKAVPEPDGFYGAKVVKISIMYQFELDSITYVSV